MTQSVCCLIQLAHFYILFQIQTPQVHYSHLIWASTLTCCPWHIQEGLLSVYAVHWDPKRQISKFHQPLPTSALTIQTSTELSFLIIWLLGWLQGSTGICNDTALAILISMRQHGMHPLEWCIGFQIKRSWKIWIAYHWHTHQVRSFRMSNASWYSPVLIDFFVFIIHCLRLPSWSFFWHWLGPTKLCRNYGYCSKFENEALTLIWCQPQKWVKLFCTLIGTGELFISVYLFWGLQRNTICW